MKTGLSKHVCGRPKARPRQRFCWINSCTRTSASDDLKSNIQVL
jgi:hypothetical protein